MVRQIPVALLVVTTVCSTIVAAQETVTMTGALEQSQVYRPNAWQPVRLEVKNPSDRAIEGVAVLPLNSTDAPAEMKVPVRVPPHSAARVSVWGYFPKPELNPTTGKKSKQPAEIPPLATAELRDAGGARLARTPVMGLPLTARAGVEADEENGQMILVVTQGNAEASDAGQDTDALLAWLSDSLKIPLVASMVGPDTLTAQPQAMAPFKAVVLDDLDPQSLDEGQRATLVEYVRGGGIVVVAAPRDSAGRLSSWLASLLPVRVIGRRVAPQIEASPGGSALKFREPAPMVEAIPTDGGEVLLGGKDYVHVARRTLGLGKIIFTSFPVNALAESQPQVAAMWEQLLELRRPRWEWGHTKLGQQRHAVLGSMIGRKVASWGVAAGVTLAYVALILAAQFLFLGPSRPKAFVVSIGGALALSAALVAMGMARRIDSAVQSARLSVLDVTGDAPGAQTESLALVGADDPNMKLESTNERVVVRPALADAATPPSIRQQPFAVEKAGVYPERIERVWEATGPTDPKLRVSAVARFGPKGLALEVDNALGQTMGAPLLVADRRAMKLADIPVGKSATSALNLNDRSDFTNAAALTSELAKRRAQVIEASLVPTSETELEAANSNAPDPSPVLIGWLADKPDGGLLRIATGTTTPTGDAKSMVMVRTPVRIEPSAVGTRVAIPPAMVRLDPGRLPYVIFKGQTVPSQEPGQWPIVFAPPAGVGSIRPARATLELRVSLPGHVLAVYKGQCVDGVPQLSRRSALVAEWTKDVGLKRVSIDCSPGDYDADGRIWLMIEVRKPEGIPATVGTPVAWQIKDLGLSIDDAEVVAPPKSFVLDAPPRPTQVGETTKEETTKEE